jgi:hypothetical protein
MGDDQRHHSEGPVVESRQHHQLKCCAGVYLRLEGYAAAATRENAKLIARLPVSCKLVATAENISQACDHAVGC